MLDNPSLPYSVDGLLTVGGVNNDGSRWTGGGTASWLNLWAPAIGGCPVMENEVEIFLPEAGTSLSMRILYSQEQNLQLTDYLGSAKTSALAAYFISLSAPGGSLEGQITSVASLKAFIVDKAYSRRVTFPNAIYNLAPPVVPDGGL